MAGRLLRLGALLRDQTAPSTPASGYLAIYANSDRPYAKDDNGAVMRMDNTAPLWFSYGGVLVVGAGTFFAVVPYPGVVEAVTAYLGTANSGTTVVDVHKNSATTIFSSTKVSFSTSSTPTVGSFAAAATFSANDRFSVDVDSVGATPGSDLTLGIWIRRTG